MLHSALLAKPGLRDIARDIAVFFIITNSLCAEITQLEATMTAAFVAGPLGAVIGFIVGFLRGGRW